jgi:hypothetical protein
MHTVTEQCIFIPAAITPGCAKRVTLTRAQLDGARRVGYPLFEAQYYASSTSRPSSAARSRGSAGPAPA